MTADRHVDISALIYSDHHHSHKYLHQGTYQSFGGNWFMCLSLLQGKGPSLGYHLYKLVPMLQQGFDKSYGNQRKGTFMP